MLYEPNGLSNNLIGLNGTCNVWSRLPNIEATVGIAKVPFVNVYVMDISRVSCQKGPTRHAYAWPIGPFRQDTLDMWY